MLTLAGSGTALAQTTPVVLGTGSYLQTFDNIGAGLPAEFGVHRSATATALGTVGPFTAAPLAWTEGNPGFKNDASADGLTATASVTDQAAAINRALAVRQVSSFDPTNLPNVGYDPGASFVFQAANTSQKTGFVLTFQLQSLDNTSSRVTTWVVDYAVGASPTKFSAPASVSGTLTTGGKTFSNNTITVNFGTALDNQAGPVTIRLSALAATTGSQTRATTAIDDFKLSWTDVTATTPVLAVAPKALTFGSQNITTTSVAQSYALTGTNIGNPTDVVATGPFQVSKDNAVFGAAIEYTADELTTPRTVYVRYAPTVRGSSTGSIDNSSTGAATVTVALSGTANDPRLTLYSFDACTGTATLSDGWTQQSVTGAQTWACTTYGHDNTDASGTKSAPNAVQISGYLGGNLENEDWLISPALNLSATSYPLLSFWSRSKFPGNPLKLRVSTTYSGSGSPSAATWTDLSATFPSLDSDVWTPTSGVDLSAYKAAKVYVAFVYTSTTAAATRWTVDDIGLYNSANAPVPAVSADQQALAFGTVAAGSSATKTLTAQAANLTGSVTVAASNPAYTVSVDGGKTFAASATLTQAQLGGGTAALTVKFAPIVANAAYTGTLTLASSGASAATVALTGDAYELAKELKVVNWNIEYFGSTTAGQGPSNKNTQQTNVTTIAIALKADVYVFEEVVDTVRFQQVVKDLSAKTGNAYAYKIAPFGSLGDNPQDPDYPGDQKVAFVYNTAVVSNASFAALLYCTQAQNCQAYSAWAAGRFPYMMTATVTLDGAARQVRFIGVHAKAYADDGSYAQRQIGSTLLKNYLDATYPSDNILILGDYNDVLVGSTDLAKTDSPYKNFVDDAAGYFPVTLALAQSGGQSTVRYKTVIDNVIASNELAGTYIPGSATAATDLANTISGYGSNTSDHYPVYTRYAFANALGTRAATRAPLGLYPNPVGSAVRLEVPEAGSHLALAVYTPDGRLVARATGTVEQLNQQLNQRLPGLDSGLYLVQVTGGQQVYTSRFQKL